MKRNAIFRAMWLAAMLACLLAVPAFADSNYLLKLWNPSNIGQVCNDHGVYLVKSMTGSASGLFVIGVPSGPYAVSAVQSLAADPSVGSLEPDAPLALPEVGGAPVRYQASLPPLYNSGQSSWYYGSQVWGAYLNQPASWIVGATYSHWISTGQSAVVALIDTGIDPNNQVLQPVIANGYDFTRNLPGGSEMADVSQSTTEVLDQSTTEVLDYVNALVLTLNQSTTEVLDQSTTEVLDQSTTEVLDGSPPPAAFGHGTMTAGLVHLVAPQALLMPLKAFNGNGGANLSNVVQAIYYAVDRGANVINMSFSAAEGSPALQAALKYAVQHGVVPVASAGNSGIDTNQIYPAAYSNVVAVASVNDLEQRSSFSNFGSFVTLAAPGEGVVTTYPGAHNYAAGWGTSFSAPLVAGVAALLFQLNPNAGAAAVESALTNGAMNVGQGLGAGEINALSSLWSFGNRY